MNDLFDRDKGPSCIICGEKSCAAAVLNNGQLNSLSENSRETYIKKGETILKAGALTSHIVYLKNGYVKEHQGEISVKSEKGKGTSIEIILPVRPEN